MGPQSSAGLAMRGTIRRAFRPSDLSIHSCLIASFVLIVLLMIAADAVAIWQYWQIEALAHRARTTEQLADAVVRVHLDVYSFRDKMVALASSHDIRQFSVEAAEIRRAFVEQVGHTEQMFTASPDIEQDAHVSYALESLRVTLLSQLDTAVQLATAGEWNAVQLRAAIEIPALIEFSSSLVEKVDQQALEKRNEASENARKARQHLFLIVPTAALLTLLAAAALGWYVTRIVTGPLSALTASAEALARGDFQHKVQLRRNNELAVLGNAFNYAAEQLQKLYDDLRQSERELRDVIETIPTFAWTALPDGSDDFVNRHWHDYTGLTAEESVGTGWQTAVHPTDLKQHLEKWRTCLATSEPFQSEVRYRRADGQYHWFLSRAVPLRDDHGKILKWYGISTDIEDRKRAEQEREELRADLAHVNRVTTMGELTASLAHEIKQPITASVINAETCLEWLKHEKPDLKEIRHAATNIVEAGRRASGIIDRLRALYKKAPPQRELVDVNEVIREMIMLLRGEASRSAVSTRTDLAPDFPVVMADRVQVQQVLMNLMLNGIEAMKDTGGILTVKSELDPDGQALISIADTGVGLPTDNKDQIFNAFFTTKPHGSGMGLAISRSIVESHGGRLWASANAGRGATFHFCLPTGAEAMRVPAVGD